MATEQAHRWHNWSGSVHARPQRIATPEHIDDLKLLVEQARLSGQHIRVIGSGHSFTPLVQTDDILLSLDRLQGIEAVDIERRTATILGGTKLKYLGEAL